MKRKYIKMHIFFESTATIMSIDLITQMVDNWLYDEAMGTNEKVSDCCNLKFETANGEIKSYLGYVPDFFPGRHYGDYIELSISKKGKVRKMKPTDKEIDKLLADYEEYAS